MEEITDERFTHITSDPRFRTTPKSIRKVKIDKRFQSLFTDKRFQVKYTVDKRGRPSNQSSQENYRKYYDILSDDESSGEEGEEDQNEKEEESNVDTDESPNNNDNSDEKQNKKKSKSPKLNKWVVTPCQSSNGKIESPEEDNGEEEVTVEDRTSSKEIKQKSKGFEVELDTDKIEKARMTDEMKIKLRDPHIDYARGVGALMSDSSSEEDSSDCK